MSSPQHDEWSAVADEFGVDLEQVRRDHLISHVLAAIAEGVATDDLVFFGGTALSRTYLTDARLSADVDLTALVPRADVAGSARQRRGLPLAHRGPRHRAALQRRPTRAAPHPDGSWLLRRQAQRVDGPARTP
jgi:hypothetical protein